MCIIRDQDNSFRRIPGTCGYTVRVRHEKAFDSSSPYHAAIHAQDIVDRITDPCLSKNAWKSKPGLSASKGALFGQLQRMPLCGCGCSLPSVAAVEPPLGVDPSDAGVDVGLLILVDPAGWDPFR